MGVWFEEAQSVFDDSHRHLFGDLEHSDEAGALLPEF
jgi:hypothetical protein